MAFGIYAVAFAWAADAVDSPPLPLGTARSCTVAVQVDGMLRCDEELGSLRLAAGVEPRGGDSVVADTVVGRMRPADIEALEQPVDLNHASGAELETLPRIGPVMAARLVAARPLEDEDALDAVRGIGPKTLERLRARVRFE